jgi:hypothetical protein
VYSYRWDGLGCRGRFGSSGLEVETSHEDFIYIAKELPVSCSSR